MSKFIEFITNIDTSILNFIQDYIRNPFLDPIMVFITKSGNDGIIWIAICALLLISKKTRYIGLVALVALLFSEVFGNILLKELFRRNRPFIGTDFKLLIKQPSGYSFPSGHTTSSFAAAFVFGQYFKKPYAVYTYILAGLIAFSRMYLYVHYPSDILFGILLGFACASLAIALFNHYKERQERKLQVQK